MGSAHEVRRLCRLASDLWSDGDGINARKALRAAQRLASDAAETAFSEHREEDPSDQLRLEVLATASRLFVRAEEPAKALLASQCALQLAEQVRRLDEYGRAAALDAKVSYITTAVNQATDPQSRHALIEDLDVVVHECLAGAAELPDSGQIAGRAINNALLLRLRPLYEDRNFSDPEAQVQAWLWVGQARRTISAAGMPEAGLQPVNRQVVDLARRLGSWERAWEAVTHSLRISYQRNEKVSLLAKAAHLAWEHGNLPDAISFGNEARKASTAVDLPWVRLYAYQAGVIAAAAGAGSIQAALDAYRSCVDIAGHATRTGRAWETAQVALDAHHPSKEVRRFLRNVGFDEHATLHQKSFAAMITSDHDNNVAAHCDWKNINLELLDAPDRARFHLAAARAALQRGRKSAAAVELNKGRAYLPHWPGRITTALNQAAATVLDAPLVTRAQQRVLDLLVEGYSNETIAQKLAISPRTVAVHIQALLHNTATKSRTDLATQELRRRFLDSDLAESVPFTL